MRHLSSCSNAPALAIKQLTKEGAVLCSDPFYFRPLQFWGLLWNKTQTVPNHTTSLWGGGLISSAEGKAEVAEESSIPGDFQGPAGDTVHAFKIPLIPELPPAVQSGNFEFNLSN